MHVVGTAGHVDHGKSTLVAALTGIHPDRLKEEQARQMTIDLGFAWLTLDNGESVGIVDVPGHRDFIENMLAGVGGIDAALFVIAADEGVMPQTREHLAIVDILQIRTGIIVLTKIDLAEDPEWLDLVEAEVRQVMRGTVLENAPLVRVSARTGEGLDELKHILGEVLAQCPSKPDLGRARLPIDRVFSVAGFGTVVTGTLSDGILRVGDEIELLPGDLRGRVRGLQTHRKKENFASPGSRTAVNISGVDVDQIRRGQVAALPGKYRATQRLDVSFQLLPDASSALRHHTEIKFFIGTAEVTGWTRILGADEIAPGEEGWIQLDLSEPVVAVRGDRYILRRPSPAETLGGGMVIDPQPAGRHKRYDPNVVQRLISLQHGTPAELLEQACLALGYPSVRDAVARARLSAEQAQSALQSAVEEGLIVQLEPGELRSTSDLLITAASFWRSESSRAEDEVLSYHRAYPLRRGMSREELKSRLKVTGRVFSAVMQKWAAEGRFIELGNLVASPQFQVKFNPAQEAAVRRLLQKFESAPFTPPSVKDSQAEVGEDVYAALLERGELVQVSPEVVFLKPTYEEMKEFVQQYLASHDGLSTAEFRDRFSTSRKYALGFLEHLDAIGLTVREGDFRRLRKKS